MEERITQISSKPSLEEAITEMTYHSGCHVLETSSPRLGTIQEETENGANGTIHNNYLAKTDGTHHNTNQDQVSSPSTCATSTNLLRQDHSPQRGKLLTTHAL